MTGVWVSMVLTSRAPRRRSPERNRRIPTIPVGYFGVVPVNVSAVDTGPLRSESGALAAEPRRLRHRSSCTALWLTSALGPLVVVGRRPRPESA